MIAFLLSSNMTILRSCQFPKQSQLDMLDPLADDIREGGPSCANVFQAVAAHNVNGALHKTFSLAPNQWQVDEHASGPDTFHVPTNRSRGLRSGFGIRGDRKSTRLNSSHVKISYA